MLTLLFPCLLSRLFSLFARACRDNHIEAAGGIPNAVHAARSYLRNRGDSSIQVEVEARTLEEVRDVLTCGSEINRVLLDNMVKIDQDGTVNTSLLEEALEIIKDGVKDYTLFTEASGNVNLQTIQKIGQTGVDFVSVGALTHSVTALDISMKIKLEKVRGFRTLLHTQDMGCLTPVTNCMTHTISSGLHPCFSCTGAIGVHRPMLIGPCGVSHSFIHAWICKFNPHFTRLASRFVLAHARSKFKPNCKAMRMHVKSQHASSLAARTSRAENDD